MVKLPVFEIFVDSYRFLWDKQNAFWSLTVPAVIIVAITGAITLWCFSLAGFGETNAVYVLFGPDSEADLPVWLYAIYGINFLVYVVILVLYSVAWHRLYLQPDEALLVREAYSWHGRHTRFLLAYIKIFLLLLLVVITLTILTIVFARGIPALGLVLLVFFVSWVYAKLGLLLPAAAVDHHMTIKEVFELSHGNGLRLFCIIMLVFIVIFLISLPIGVGIASVSDATVGSSSLTANLLIGLVSQFLGFISVAATVSALSISYARLTGGADQTMLARFD